MKMLRHVVSLGTANLGGGTWRGLNRVVLRDVGSWCDLMLLS